MSKVTTIPKFEWILNISDGDRFYLKNKMDHLFTYHKDTMSITDEKGAYISGDTLLYIVNHPDEITVYGQGSDALESMGSMIAKLSFMAVVFFILSIISARMLLMQTHPAWTLQFLLPVAMFAVCLLGMGVCGGVIVTSILHHKELM